MIMFLASISKDSMVLKIEIGLVLLSYELSSTNLLILYNRGILMKTCDVHILLLLPVRAESNRFYLFLFSFSFVFPFIFFEA